MVFIPFIISVMPKPSRAINTSAGIPSGPVAFPCFVLLSACLNATRLVGSSVAFAMVDGGPLVSQNKS